MVFQMERLVFTIFYSCFIGQVIAVTIPSDGGILYVKEGNNLDIICETNVSTIGNVAFILNETAEISVFNLGIGMDCQSDPKYNITCDYIKGIFTYIISSYEYSDSGNWTCRVALPNGIFQHSDPVTVYYIDPFDSIAILPNSNHTTIRENETEIFRCETSFGRPKADIAWYKKYSNGSIHYIDDSGISFDTIKNETRSKTLSMFQYRAAAEDNSALLYCRGYIRLFNDSDTQRKSSNILLDVQYPPRKGPFLDNDGNLSLKNGTPINILCFSYGGNPLASLAWACDGENLDSSDKSNTSTAIYLLSIQAKPSLNGKHCSCKAQHLLAQDRSVSCLLDVEYKAFTNVTLTSTPDLYVNESSNMNLMCTVYGGNPMANVSLRCDESNFKEHISNDSFSISTSMTFNASRNDNQKICRCVANHFLWKEPIVERKQIKVYFPPKPMVTFDGILNETELYEFDIASAKCEVSDGNPFATIDFRCGTTMIGQTDNDSLSAFSSITVNVTRILNLKHCVCTAKHLLYSHDISGIIILHVNYPPNQPRLLVSPKHPFLEGDFVEITCNVTGGFPHVSKYEWYINSDLQPTQTKQNRLIYGNVTKDDNSKLVYCRVHNKFTEERNIVLVSESMKFNVQYAPIITQIPQDTVVDEGQSINIVCKASGNPIPSVYLEKDNHTIVGSNTNESVLYYTNVDRTAQGVYNCVAYALSSTNRSLTISSSFFLTVNYAPDVSVAILGHNVSDGNSIILVCNASGQPAEYVYSEWKHSYNNINIQNRIQNNGSHLFLRQLSYQDMGNYSCSVNNGIENRNQTLLQKASLEVKVAGSPIRIPEISTVPVYTAEQFKTLYAGISFFSFPNVTDLNWYNLTSNTLLVPTNSTAYELFEVELPYTLYDVEVDLTDFCYEASLIIHNFQPYHSGSYALEVLNGERKVNFTLRAVVSGPPEHPSNITVEVSGTSIFVHVLPGSDGGHSQFFHINYTLCGYYNMVEKIFPDSGSGFQTFNIDSLQPSTQYCLFVSSRNKKGPSSFNDSHCCEEFVIRTGREFNSENQGRGSTLTIVGGSIGSVLAICLIVGVIVFVRLRRNEKGGDKKHLNFKSREDDKEEDEDGLKDNPLYGSGVNYTSSLSQDCCSAASKTRKKKKLQTKDNDKSSGEIQLDTVYENSNQFLGLNREAFYANQSGNGEPKGPETDMKHKNKYGLIYAELDFAPDQGGKKIVIRGLENKTNYAFIDYAQTADPLPSDDEEDTVEVAGKTKN